MSNIQTQLNLVSNPFAHYRVEDVTVDQDQQIHNWVDVSGQGNHLAATASGTTRAVSPITTDGPVLKHTQYVGVGNIDKSVYFNEDKMYSMLNNPITVDQIDVYVICRSPESYYNGHMMGLESSLQPNGKGFSFGRTPNTSWNFQVCDGTTAVNTPGIKNQFTLYRMSIDTDMLSTYNLITNQTNTVNRTTILNIQTNPLDILTLGAGVWTSNNQQYPIKGIEIVEVVMFNSILSDTDHNKLTSHLIDKYDMTNKYLVPSTGSCVYLDGQVGSHVVLTENDQTGPSISCQQSFPTFAHATPRFTACMYELWFHPEFYEPDDPDHPKKELVFSTNPTNTFRGHYVYLDRDRHKSNGVTELLIRNEHYWWLNTGSTRVYNQWNRLCMVCDTLYRAALYLNGEQIFLYDPGHVYINHHSVFDYIYDSVVIGDNGKANSTYTSFRGKVLGVRKIRDDFQTLIDQASEKIRFDQHITSTSTTVTPAADIGMQPLYRNTQNIYKLPDLISGRHESFCDANYSSGHLGIGFNAWNPDFTGLEGNVSCFNRIIQTYGRFKNLQAFRDVLTPRTSYHSNSHFTLTAGRLETLSHLRGSKFNARSQWYIFDVSQNRLTDVDGLQDMKRASYLRLNNNRISDLSAFTELEPGCLENIVEINLSNNQITSIPAGTFTKFDGSLKNVFLQGNQITTLDNLSELNGLSYLIADSVYYTSNSSIEDISNMTSLRSLQMHNTPNITVLPDLTQTNLQYISLQNNPDLIDISSLADPISNDSSPTYSSARSETDALYWMFNVTGNELLDASLLTNRAAAGGRISVSGRLYLSGQSQINDLTIFQNSYQDDTYTYRTNQDLARLMLNDTSVTDTANSLGIMRNFKYCNRIYLQRCDTPTLHQHAFSSNPAITRDEAYNIWFGRYCNFEYNTISDMSFLLNPQAAGIQYLYLDHCPNVTYESFAAIKDQLINLKQTTNMRLYVISLTYTDWDYKQSAGELGPICVNGVPSPQLQLKKDLWDVGIRLGFRGVSSSYPERLGNGSQLPTC